MRWSVLVVGLSNVRVGWNGVWQKAWQEKPSKKISEAEIKRFINRQSDVDECESLDQIHLDHVEYFDFLGDGQQEAVVVASTCMTETAGPGVPAGSDRGVDTK